MVGAADAAEGDAEMKPITLSPMVRGRVLAHLERYESDHIGDECDRTWPMEGPQNCREAVAKGEAFGLCDTCQLGADIALLKTDDDEDADVPAPAVAVAGGCTVRVGREFCNAAGHPVDGGYRCQAHEAVVSRHRRSIIGELRRLREGSPLDFAEELDRVIDFVGGTK